MWIAEDIRRRRLARPFDIEIALGSYWITSLRSKPCTAAVDSFAWLLAEAAATGMAKAAASRRAAVKPIR